MKARAKSQDEESMKNEILSDIAKIYFKAF